MGRATGQSPQPTVAGTDWHTASLIHHEEEQTAASTVLMMSKDGKELVVSQVFPLQAQTERLEVGKTQGLLHLVLLGREKGW